MTGRELFERHVDCSGGGTDAKDYYARMNPADRRGWEQLAELLTGELAAAYCEGHNAGIVQAAEALDDAWKRRESRRCQSTR
jgi:hypothetical protein